MTHLAATARAAVKRVRDRGKNTAAVPAAKQDVTADAVAAPVQHSQVLFTQIERETDAAQPTEVPYRALGWRVFITLVIFISAAFVALVIFSCLTYPRLGDYQALARTAYASSTQGTATSASNSSTDSGTPAVGNTQEADALAAYDAAKQSWIDEVKDLGQLFIVTPLIPLLGTVIGYMFGRSKDRETSD